MRVLALFFACALGAAAQPADDLAELEALLDEPVQTASTYTQRVSEAPASVTILGSEEIGRMGHRTLGEALATVRGLFLANDRTYTTIGVRGVNRPDDYNSRVAVLVDGVPLRDAVGGASPLGAELGIPLAAVERIEVIRGPGSTLYGTGAMLAVINVILKDVRTLDGVRATATAGAYGAVRGEAVAATSLPSQVDVSIALHGMTDDGPDVYFPEYDAPETAGGVATGLDWERSRGALARVQRGAVRLDLRYASRIKGDPTAPLGSRFGDEASTSDHLATAALLADHELSPTLAVSALGALQSYDRDIEYPLTGPAGPTQFVLTTRSSSARLEGRVRWDPAPAHRLLGGAEVVSELQSRYRFTYGDAPVLDADAPLQTVAAYAQTESQFGRSVSLTAGLRLDAVGSDVAVSPRGALVVRPGARTSVKLIAGSAFRAPSTYERVYENRSIRQVAAPGLRPERVSTAEVLAAHEVVPGLRIDAALFGTRAEGLIDIRVTDPSTGSRQFVNVGRVEGWGAEGGAESALGGWRTRLSYGYQRTWDPDVAEALLTHAPVHTGKASTYGPIGRGLWLAASAQTESGRRTVQGVSTAPYTVVDATLSADVFGGGGRLAVGVRNALDTAYAFPGGFKHVQAAIPQRPRSAYVRLDVRL